MPEIEITHMCLACAAGLYSECTNPEIVVIDPEMALGVELEEPVEWIIPCAVRFSSIEPETAVKVKGEIGRPLADPKDITDPRSTGRKRAIIALPGQTGMLCQWAGLKWAGGGVQPIVGCAGNKLAEFKKNEDKPEGIDSRIERHHGPNKAVLDNSVGVNLHGICSDCHHRWHELNDPFYEGERPAAEFEWLPALPYYSHDPHTKATDDERQSSEAWWAQGKKDRQTYPVELPPEDRLRQPAEESILTDNTTENPFEDPDNPFDII